MPPSAKIVSLDLAPLLVPMSEPHQTASGTITESPLIATTVRTSAGISGYSLLFTYTRTALKPTADLIRNLEPLITGRDLAPAAITHALHQKFRLLGTEGLLGMAIAAIDMALWDALARIHESPLYRLLGHEPQSVPAYGGVGYEGVKGSAQTAARWAERGLRGVKMKIGYPTVDEDRQVILAVKQAVPREMAIMVDYNQRLTPADAIARIRRLEDLDLTWIEEPVAAHDHEGHAVVARAVQTPIQSGENWWGPSELRQAIAAKASDYVMLDVMKIGGVTGWLEAAALASTHAILVSNHLWPEISAQLLSATPGAHYLEYIDWWNPVLEQPLELHDGLARPSDLPGTGISFNPEALARYAA